MDLVESHNMSADEEFDHWWIATRFRYVDQVIALASAGEGLVSVIEFGCGTAQNLRFCRQRSRFRHRLDRLVGVDPERLAGWTLGDLDHPVFAARRGPGHRGGSRLNAGDNARAREGERNQGNRGALSPRRAR